MSNSNAPVAEKSGEYKINSLETRSNHDNINLALKQAICWAIMFGVGENSFSLFAHHLNAPVAFYSALVWIPAFLGPFIQIIAANLLDHYQTRVKMVYIACFIQALSFVPLVMVAYWSKDLDYSATRGMTIYLYLFLLSLLLYHMSGSFASPPWQSFVGDLVSQDQRGRFFAKFTRAISIVSLTCQLLLWLTFFLVAFYLNNSYVVLSIVFSSVFFISYVSRCFSVLILTKIIEPHYQASSNTKFSFWQFIKRARESNFVKFVFFISVLHCGANISAPYFLLYWLDDLKYSSSQWIILASAGSISAIITLLVWGRFSDLFGNKKTMTYCAFLISITPFLWLVSDNMYYLITLQIIAMTFWTGLNLSSMNYIYEAASPPKRARCFAYFSVITGGGVLLGTQIGLFISTHIPKNLFNLDFKSSFCWVLIASGLVRLLACCLFLPLFKELREVKPFKTNTLFVDVIKLNSIWDTNFFKNDEISKNKDEKND